MILAGEAARLCIYLPSSYVARRTCFFCVIYNWDLCYILSLLLSGFQSWFGPTSPGRYTQVIRDDSSKQRLLTQKKLILPSIR